MKITQYEAELIKKVRLADFKQYLTKNAWEEDREIGDRAIVFIKTKLTGNSLEILLPKNHNAPDLSILVFEALKILEQDESRSYESILIEILGQLSAKIFAEKIGREIIQLKLSFPDERQSEAPIGSLGVLLRSFQSLIDSIGHHKSGLAGIKSPIPDYIKEQTKISIIGTYSGSFGMRLAAPRLIVDQKELELGKVSSSLTIKTIDEFFELIKVSKNKDLLREKLTSLKQRSTSSYQRFLESFVATEAEDASIDWGSIKEEYGGSVSLSYLTANRAIEIVKETAETNEEEYVIQGKLIGLNIRRKEFEIVPLNNENVSYEGKISDEVMELVHNNEMSFNNKIYTARIREKIDVKQVTGESIHSYRLISLQKINIDPAK
jgi:hypothetical protein